ncbi:MAG: PIN domain-containing protein [Candidatus Margulisbacteria bacterium]|jgi:PIN domain nuclease of toxin-antitoxin system|nr:PIN domain-containing protein [Candidatus Margulisiibacteriota bacterium]
MLYILDACALIAYLTNEPGADFVETVLSSAQSNPVIMHKLNLLEVYYGFYKDCGKEKAAEMLQDVQKLNIRIISDISDELILAAGRLKATYKISLADAVCLAQAGLAEATIVSSDHHEFDIIDKNEPLNFAWLR